MEGSPRQPANRGGFTQLCLTLDDGGGAYLPINYRPLIQGQIYRALRLDEDYSFSLHSFPGALPDERRFKGFTFSPLTGQYRVDHQAIAFHGPIRLEIRGVEPYFIELLESYFRRKRALALRDTVLEVISLDVTDRHLLAPEAVVTLVSPAAAYTTIDKRTVFFSPDMDEFYAALRENAAGKFRTFSREGGEFSLDIAPAFSSPPRRQFSLFKRTYITAWYGRYALKGNPEAIDILYQTGLGSKNSQGYGLFERDQ